MVQALNQETFSLDELVHALEPLIRRVVREELGRAIAQDTEALNLKPDSPLYEDMIEIARRKDRGAVTLHEHSEVWGE